MVMTVFWNKKERHFNQRRGLYADGQMRKVILEGKIVLTTTDCTYPVSHGTKYVNDDSNFVKIFFSKLLTFPFIAR